MITENKAILEKLQLLEEKYAAMGQDMEAYLDGLLYSDYLNYWEYTNLDVLLRLQQPRTAFPDEMIFIGYHQITELYFQLIRHELKQIAFDKLSFDKILIKIKRLNAYFRNLVYSFEIMIDGMEKEQFLKFRMSLLPASGFQSAQYRLIELYSTDIDNLLAPSKRSDVSEDTTLQEKIKWLYWQHGATELSSGKKTLTLKHFEKKYGKTLLDTASEYGQHNLRSIIQQLPTEEKEHPELIQELRQYDHYANVQWPIMHMKSAARYLRKDPEDIAATGGTNWQKYLPPKNQQIMFFPELWSEMEIREWGKKEVLTKA